MKPSNESVEINLESNYISSVDRDHRKKLGQFFTPKVISDLMAKWISEIDAKCILDPAVGTGVLVRSIRELGLDAELITHEIDEKVVGYCKQQFELDNKLSLNQTDYLSSRHGKIFDAAIANPPYIRHHDFTIKPDDKSHIEQEFGKIPNTSNIYVYFVLKIISDLKNSGRASIIIPSDWLNSNFGRAFKRIVFNSGIVSKVLYFRNDLDPFADNLSTATILFLDKSKSSPKFKLAVVGDQTDQFLNIGHCLLSDLQHEAISEIDPTSLNIDDKWGPIFEGLHQSQPQGWIRLNDLGKSKRGIATGANSFFLVSTSKLKENGLSKVGSRPCLGRSKDVQGLIFDESDFLSLSKTDAPVRLLDLNPELESDLAYIQAGIAMGLEKRFLLANRTPWFKQEVRPPAQVLVGVFGRDGVRFIWNRSKATNLTTFHGLYLDLDSQDVGVLVALLNSSLLQAHNRKTERSYGGGLQKVEPKDLLEMDIPDPRNLSIALKDQLISALVDSDQMRKANVEAWRTPLDFVINSNRESLSL